VRGSIRDEPSGPHRSAREKRLTKTASVRSFDLIPRGRRCQWAVQSRPESKDLREYSELRRDHRSGGEGGGGKEERRRASDGSKEGRSELTFRAEGRQDLPLDDPEPGKFHKNYSLRKWSG